MNDDMDLTEHFDGYKSHYFNQIEQEANDKLSLAGNQAYVLELIIGSLTFLQHSQSNSPFNAELLELFEHACKVNPEQAITAVLSNLEALKESHQSIEQVKLGFFDFSANEVPNPPDLLNNGSEKDIVTFLALYHARQKFIALNTEQINEGDSSDHPLDDSWNNDTNIKLNHSSNDDFTLNRRILANYFEWQALGYEPRRTGDVSAFARLLHFKLGVGHKKIVNSEIYKRLRKVPNIVSDDKLLSDLNYIRKYYVNTNMDLVVEMIDREIALIKLESEKNSNI